MRYYNDDHELDKLREIRRRQRRQCGGFEPARKQPVRKAVNGCRYDDFDEDDDDEEDDQGRIEVSDVIQLLKSSVYHQEGLRKNAEKLKRWLYESEEFTTAWQDFTDSGGVNADDFKSFMAGTFRCRRIPRKKHLRLVANNKHNA